MKKREFCRYIILTAGFGLVVFLANCTNQNNHGLKTQMPLTSNSIPEFILSIDPVVVSQDVYDDSLTADLPLGRGIVVELNGYKIGLSPENKSIEVVEERAALFVDGQQVSSDSLMITDGMVGSGGPYWLSWTPHLSLGAHVAKFQFETDAGEILEYEWQIEITK